MEIEKSFCEFNKYLEKNEKIDMEKSNIKNFLKEIQNKIEKMKEILVIDRFEGDVAICENRETKSIKVLKKSELPENAQEGSVLKWTNGKYKIDEVKQREIEEKIKSKMDDLWE